MNQIIASEFGVRLYSMPFPDNSGVAWRVTSERTPEEKISSSRAEAEEYFRAEVERCRNRQ